MLPLAPRSAPARSWAVDPEQAFLSHQHWLGANDGGVYSGSTGSCESRSAHAGDEGQPQPSQAAKAAVSRPAAVGDGPVLSARKSDSE